MLKLIENFQVDWRILKCDYKRCSPAEVSAKNIPNSQRKINIPREDSVISSLNSCLERSFEIIKKAYNSRYAKCKDLRLVNLGPIAIFSNFISTTSGGRH